MANRNPMRIQYVGGASANLTGSISLTALTGGMDTQPRTNDLVIVSLAVSDSGNFSTQSISDGGSPYTLIGSELYGDGAGATDVHLRMAYKAMGPTPDTTVTINDTAGSTNGRSGLVQVWRFVDLDVILDVAPTSAVTTGSGPSLPVNAAITPISPGAKIICAGTSTGTAFSSGLQYPLLGSGSGSSRGVTNGLASLDWAGGSVTPGAWSGGGTSTWGWAALTVALRPAQLL